MQVWLLVVMVIAIVFLLFAITFYLYWFSRNYNCDFNPNPWCWYDWRCIDASGNTTFPAQTLYGCGDNGPGKTYPTRDANYCNANPPPPGCRCMPDKDGNISPNCAFGWASPNQTSPLGPCADKLQSYGDGDDGTFLRGCVPPAGDS